LVGDSTSVRARVASLFISTAGQKTVNQGHVGSIRIALPPLAEQHRIVARVGELMKLCDSLEQSGRLADEQHARLTSTLFDALAASESAHALAENWQRVAEHFDLLLDRPEAIDDLERTVLQLAVRGLLVIQNSVDESASELLDRIAAHRRMLSGSSTRPVPLTAIDQIACPFPLPPGWIWVQWETVALQIGDVDHKMPREVVDGVPYISPRDFTDGNGIDFAGAKKISESDYEELASKIKPERGDLIYPRYGTIGKVRLVDTDSRFLASYSCAVIKCMNEFIDCDYQYLVSISALIADQAAAATNKTTQPNVGLRSIKAFLFPLPPLAEQHRIVARVEELRLLCTQLRERLTAARRTQTQLAEALVATVA
jgi:type I restriction enzyme, S subunit